MSLSCRRFQRPSHLPRIVLERRRLIRRVLRESVATLRERVKPSGYLYRRHSKHRQRALAETMP